MYRIPLKTNIQQRKVILKVCRQGFYFAVLLTVVLGLWCLSDLYKINTFAEYGLVENLQLATLFVSSLIFLGSSIKKTFYRPILILLASLTSFCCIRELDSFFENFLPITSWKFAFLLPLGAILYLYTQRKNLKKSLFEFLASPTFDLMFMAMIIFIPLAQCIGHRSFIEDAIGTSDNLIHIRRLIEESMEFMAYVLILFSSIEMSFKVFKKD